jgi:hypothetical protein
MTAPYVSSFSLTGYLVVSIVLGFFFGFFLERAGFSSARKLTAQFYLKDFAVLKVMFTAIVVSMLGLAYLGVLGWIDMSQIYVPPTFLWPQIVGGLLLGSGFIVGGYCPGTSVVAAAIGKLDALFFIAGIFLGIFVFGNELPNFAKFNSSGSMGALTLPLWLDVNVGLVVLAVVVIALAAFWVGERCEGGWDSYDRTYGKFIREEKS